MAKLTLTDLANLENDTTAVNAINNNNTAIETALENTLSRDGTSPNTMGADLDMNSQKITNLGAPVNPNDAARLVDVTGAGDLLSEFGELLDDAETAANNAAGSALAAAGAKIDAELAQAAAEQAASDAEDFAASLDDATTDIAGRIEIATNAEALTGTDTERAITPDDLAYVFTNKVATTTDKGTVELATDTEFAEQSSSSVVVTPSNLAARPSFSAHKNGTNQTGIPSTTLTKVTFTTEEWDIGGYYDAAASRWTPPAGKYFITGAVTVTGSNIIANSVLSLYIYKNGVGYKAFNNISASTSGGTVVTALVEADGDDYFELFFIAGGAGNKSLGGTPTGTYFQGFQI